MQYLHYTVSLYHAIFTLYSITISYNTYIIQYHYIIQYLHYTVSLYHAIFTLYCITISYTISTMSLIYKHVYEVSYTKDNK